MGKLVNPSAWHAGDPQFEPGWKQKDLSTLFFLSPSFAKISFWFQGKGQAKLKTRGKLAKDEDVFETLRFRRQTSVSRWAWYKSVPGSGRVSISVSMPACHAGELGSIPRRGGESLPTYRRVVSPFFFGSNFGSEVRNSSCACIGTIKNMSVTSWISWTKSFKSDRVAPLAKLVIA